VIDRIASWDGPGIVGKPPRRAACWRTEGGQGGFHEGGERPRGLRGTPFWGGTCFAGAVSAVVRARAKPRRGCFGGGIAGIAWMRGLALDWFRERWRRGPLVTRPRPGGRSKLAGPPAWPGAETGREELSADVWAIAKAGRLPSTGHIPRPVMVRFRSGGEVGRLPQQGGGSAGSPG